MKILLSESQFNLIRNLDKQINQIYLNNLVESVLLEANKKDVLINKVGLSEVIANELQELAGNLSVWLANKLLLSYEDPTYKWIARNPDMESERDRFLNDKNFKRKMILKYVNDENSNNFRALIRRHIPSIMDWYRVGLNGNIKPYENLSFDELYEKSVEWHESLQIGDSKIDYEEKKEIILDFRQDGEGFYWVDLATSQCSEEAKRMGHCASSKGQLYSLREYRKIPNEHTLNKSHLTASIDSSGILLQLKGPKNSKPNPQYNKYIIELLTAKYPDNDVEYIIDGFGYEYNSKNDFKISDLSEDEIKHLYSLRPELFTKYTEKKLLISLGIINKKEINNFNKFILELQPSDISTYVSGGWDVKRIKRENGTQFTIDIFEVILYGDVYDLWDNYNADWKSELEYHVDKVTEKRIISILEKMALKNEYEFNPKLSIVEMISEYDDDKEIIRIIQNTINDAEADSYYTHLYNKLRNALTYFGKIIILDDTGAKIEIDLNNILDNIDADIDEYFERCDGDGKCIFNELFHDGYIEKPEFNIDDRWYPDIDKIFFNEILNDRLPEIE